MFPDIFLPISKHKEYLAVVQQDLSSAGLFSLNFPLSVFLTPGLRAQIEFVNIIYS